MTLSQSRWGIFTPLSIAAAVLLALNWGGSLSAQVVLTVNVHDTTAESGTQGLTIPIYVQNVEDTIAGFVLQLYLDRPDIIDLRPDYDLNGTLLEDWEYVEANQLGGLPTNLRLIGLANLPAAPHTPGIGPQTGSVPFVRIRADVHDFPDTAQDRTVQIHIVHDNLYDFGFSDPQGSSIGTITDSILDTIYWNCLVWEEDTCIEWEWLEEPINPEDSSLEVWRPYSYIDTSAVFVSDGSVTVLGGYVCGDITGDGEGPNIADLVYLVNYMFSGGPPPSAMAAADCTGDGELDITDLVCFVTYMFNGGPPPTCSS